MLQARRSGLRASRTVSRQLQRSYAGQSGSHSDHQHTVDQPHPVEQANENESFGPRFFLALTALPLCWIAYDYSTSDAKNPPWLTRYITTYDSWWSEWERRNDLHERAVRQAAHDRLLFRTAGPTKMIDMKFPEQFNSGSHVANVAGHRGDLTEVVKRYQENNRVMEEQVANKTQEQRDKYL